jgi:DNA-binding NarL/FixJ family response regulator
MKQEATEKVLTAINEVLAGRLYLSGTASETIIRKLVDGPADSGDSLVHRLSDRELEVLQLLGRGRGTRQIANELHLSVKTIESHRAHIKEKLNLQTAPELVRFAVQWYNRKIA